MSFEIDITVSRGDKTISGQFKAPNGLTALFGPSGIGKTTVLDAVAGLLKPDRGRIVVSDHVLFDSELGIDVVPEQRACGYVFQDLRLFPHYSVENNLLFGQRLTAPHRRWISADEAIAFLGIGHLLRRMPRTLSGGEAQRVAIGRALLSAPNFLLMDEPLSSLDKPRREEIMLVIERIRDELKLPILYVSHEAAELDRLADQTIPVHSR